MARLPARFRIGYLFFFLVGLCSLAIGLGVASRASDDLPVWPVMVLLVGILLTALVVIRFWLHSLPRSLPSLEGPRSEDELRKTLTAALVGTWEWDVVADRTVWSENIDDWFGTTPDVRETTFEQFIARVVPEDRERIYAAVSEVLAEEELSDRYRSEFRIQADNGTIHWLETRGRVFRNAEGRPDRMMGTVMDVSERHRVADELRAARDEANSANQAKSAFLANMSHEIRTPLNGIIGTIELLAGSSISPGQQGHLNTLRKSAESLLSLINNILDISKIEAGKLELEEVPFVLYDLVQDAVGVLAGQAARKDLTLTCDLGPDLPAAVLGDPGRLRQVLLNLLSNAIKFTTAGTVTIRVHKEQIGAAPSSPLCSLHFEVRDTGIGIPGDKLASIFEPFAQAESSTARTHGGTGLGLTITRRLVERMGGKLMVVSTPGQGSTFSFTVPLRPTQLPPVGERGVSPPVGERGVSPPVGERRGVSPPVGERGVSPPVGERGVSPPVGERGVSPPVGERGVSPPVGERRGVSPPVGERGVSPPVGERGVSPPVDAPATGGLTPRRSPESALGSSETPGRPVRVLLVEDNPINQQVMMLLLEQSGYHVELAGNGREALAAFEERPFDLVLMDLQMPEMDGLRAARLIRAREKAVGGHVPIVAVTANVLQGERERCLAAGMDDYLSKPIRAAELFPVIEKLIGTASQAPPAEAPSSSAASQPVWLASLSNMGFDQEAVNQLARTFVETLPPRLASLRQALSASDASEVQRTAHSLRGSLTVFGAIRAIAAAGRLEGLGHQRQLDQSASAMADLEAEVQGMLASMTEYLEKSS